MKWAANKNVKLEDGTRILAGDVLTMDDIENIVVESDLILTTYQYAVKYSITYNGGDNGSIYGIKSEEVAENSPLLGTNTKAKDGYVFSHWVANKKVTLKDGTFIESGENITSEQLTNVIATEDLILTAMYKKQLFTINYVSDSNGTITGITSEEKMIDQNLSGSVTKANDDYMFLHWIADKDITLTDNKIITKGNSISNEQLLDVVINDDITFTAIHVKEKLVLVYKGEEGINIPENNKETVKYGASPLGINIKSNSSTRKIVYVLNRDVVLKDGTKIVNGKEITLEQLKQVIITDDLVVMAKYVKEEVVNNIPDTFKMNSIISILSGLIFVLFGGSIFYTTIYKKKMN